MTTVIARAAEVPEGAPARTAAAAALRAGADGSARGCGLGDGPWGQIGLVRPSDGPALAALFARCSPETVRLRFFAPVPALPREYVEAVLAGLPEEHDAVVAYGPGCGPGLGGPGFGKGGRGHLIGLGSLAAGGGEPLGRNGDGNADRDADGGGDGDGSAGTDGGRPPAEIGLLVADAWQRQGVGAAMLDVLLARARNRDVRRVSAFVLPGRSALLAVLTRHLEPEGFAHAGDGLTGVYRLNPPQRKGPPTA